MFGFLKRKPASAVEIDAEGVRRALGDGKVERVAWEDLVEVQIVTTDEGPFVDDVFFLLIGANGTGCVVPQEDPQSGALLSRLQELPGFDNGKVIEAMTCTANARFVCWKKA
jgi:hypothetical protein